jgi:hypothetical protein
VVTLRIPVGVEVESRPSSNRWQSRIARVVGIRPGARHIPDWQVLAESDEAVRYYAGTAKLAVHSTDTKVYKDNVEARQPSLFVVLRKGASPVGWALHLVTVDPTEAHAHVDVGDDLVEALPMPPPMRDWLALFVAQHHVERKEWKRKRDPAVPPDERRPRPPEEGFLDRWSQRKREAARSTAPGAPPPGAPPAVLEDDAAGASSSMPGADAAPAPPAEGQAAPGLPDVDSLDATSDYRAFLQSGVPKALRHAALRRAWSTAPAIRNHKPLVDYDWDFNAPGYGKLLPTDDASKLTSALFRHLRTLADAGEEDAPADGGPAPAEGADAAAAVPEDAPEDPPKPA